MRVPRSGAGVVPASDLSRGAATRASASAAGANPPSGLTVQGPERPAGLDKLEGPRRAVSAEAPAPAARVVGGEKLEPAFKSFMKVDRLRLDVERPGAAGAPPTIEPVTVAALRGPGDNCTMVVPVVLAADGRPSVVVKAGSTRAAAELREPGRYVMLGMVGGRWDKSIGADAAGIAKKIGIAELAEEIGATAVKGGAFTLGDRLTATMPSISTEADLAVGVLARVSADATPTGDHSGMEVVGLMKPVALEPRDALARSRRGELGEGARFEAYTRRFLDKLGFVPELDAYVFDLPPALRKAFDTRGLGA